MTGIRFTRSAETDLLELWLNIAEENLVAADESLEIIQAAVSVLSSQPEMGRARPVEFVARYKVGGHAHRLHEVSHFVLEEVQWFYLDGEFQN